MFKPRPYDPDRSSKQTLAQQTATERNFRVFRLHGLHSAMRMLTGLRRDMAQMMVDQELTAMGADTTAQVQSKRIQKQLRKRRKEEALRRANPHPHTEDPDCLCENCLDIPF